MYFIEGEQGAIGMRGKVGPAGPEGVKGDRGEIGIQGMKGHHGLPGLPGSLNTFTHVMRYISLDCDENLNRLKMIKHIINQKKISI